MTMMKSIRKGGISMLLLLGLAGCGKEIPSDIIQPSEMESLLYDYHLATTMGNDLPYGETYKKEAYLDYVFDKHHVTEAEFDSSMVWYTRHTYHLVTIYENVQKRFEEDEKHLRMRMSKVSGQVAVSLSGDSVDIWQDQPICWLSSGTWTNKLVFDLKADTSFKPKDALVFEAGFLFMPQHNPSAKAVIGLNFYFENDSVMGKTQVVTASGPQRLYFKPDSAFQFKNVSGFVYYTDDQKHPEASLLLHDIRLMRYHDKNNEIQSPEEKPGLQADSLAADSSRMAVRVDTLRTTRPVRGTAARNKAGQTR
ncbi:hypothetical protein BACCOPRO_01174 [Phocaeicola coprophilus DSM 18228 = JCM 13818]|jgi:hypothetical protein|uniref:DUF4296 domain-containing protein n=3 Tax=Phocaeicola coprophilus TaxID=387090 RepID=S0F5Y3_9BACT|nr:hypothetical protein BACCOPRO_01174 [Phocaeicola coprophilus DSM 18228 = JCM 13818]